MSGTTAAAAVLADTTPTPLRNVLRSIRLIGI
jgi:hypothetical protein